tara:strand:- start:901 stop:1332 length:432 start_codon:yes stop_codon:yes gene_type:complete
MLKVTRLADYAVLILCQFSFKRNTVLSSTKICRGTGIKKATVNKLLALLVKGNVLSAVRGPRGGYKPSRELENISVKEIIEAIEGPVSLTDCIDNNSTKCNLISTCVTKNTWSMVNSAIVDTLHSIKVEHLNAQFSTSNNFDK